MKIFLEDEKLQNLIKNANVYIKDEQLLLEDFKKIFSSLNYNYKTKNTSKLNELYNDINDNLYINNTNSINDTIIIEKTIEKYDNILEKIKSERQEINKIN